MKNIRDARISGIILGFMVMLAGPYAKTASAEALYGCPRADMVMAGLGTCPDGSAPSLVKEGYVYRGGKALLDTFSDEEKRELGIQKDNKFIVVIYRSANRREASFEATKGSNKEIVELAYTCGDKILAVRPLFKDCKPLAGEDSEAIYQQSLRKAIEESRPKFFQQQKAAGYTNEKIESLWKEYKKIIEDEYQQAKASGDFSQIGR